MSTRRRIQNGALGLGFVVATELARAYYRPFVRARGIHDFHIADTLGNSLGTLAAVFVALAIFGHGGRGDLRYLVIAPVSVFVYEIAHPLLGRAIDPWDLLATVGAGSIVALLHRLMYGPAAASDDGSVVVANRAASVDA